MDKKNEKTAQTNEMMELTPEQMEKVNGGFRRYDECPRVLTKNIIASYNSFCYHFIK